MKEMKILNVRFSIIYVRRQTESPLNLEYLVEPVNFLNFRFSFPRICLDQNARAFLCRKYQIYFL